jgi:hypothetical protein
MSKYYIQQICLLPFVWFGFVIIASLFAENYSHITHHFSALAVNTNKTAVLISTIGAATMGIMMILFSIGLILYFKKRLLITSSLIAIFGISFLFGSVFPMGSPLHSLYDISLSIVLAPFIFLYEINKFLNLKRLNNISLICGFLAGLYLWASITRIDPQVYAGITQRLYALVLLGWMAYVGYILAKYLMKHPKQFLNSEAA